MNLDYMYDWCLLKQNEEAKKSDSSPERIQEEVKQPRPRPTQKQGVNPSPKIVTIPNRALK
jgi:hypothetical protein